MLHKWSPHSKSEMWSGSFLVNTEEYFHREAVYSLHLQLPMVSL